MVGAWLVMDPKHCAHFDPGLISLVLATCYQSGASSLQILLTHSLQSYHLPRPLRPPRHHHHQQTYLLHLQHPSTLYPSTTTACPQRYYSLFQTATTCACSSIPSFPPSRPSPSYLEPIHPPRLPPSHRLPRLQAQQRSRQLLAQNYIALSACLTRRATAAADAISCRPIRS
jgi:hypothetical protein